MIEYNNDALRTDFKTFSGKVIFSISDEWWETSYIVKYSLKLFKMFFIAFAVLVYAMGEGLKEGELVFIVRNYEAIFNIILLEDVKTMEDCIKGIERYKGRKQ